MAKAQVEKLDWQFDKDGYRAETRFGAFLLVRLPTPYAGQFKWSGKRVRPGGEVRKVGESETTYIKAKAACSERFKKLVALEQAEQTPSAK